MGSLSADPRERGAPATNLLRGTDLPAAVARSWSLLPHDRDAVAGLARRLSVAPVVAQLLLNRGLGHDGDARAFLDAPLTGLHPPELLPGVNAAVERIADAVRAGRRLCVFGDYDVDGLSGSAILLRCLRLLGAAPDLYVPNRLEEGYGLNGEALRQIAAAGASLVVTVDCGIAGVREAEEAKRLGLELIVTDHHEYGPTLPDAAALVHPRLPGTAYPFGKLSGSAVAFKLAWALAKRDSGDERVTPRWKEYLLDAVALAALGVVADVVPLHGENRILVRHGLARLNLRPGVGLRALCASAGLGEGAELRASDIGFRLAPRLNAAGRLGQARQVVELLTTTSPDEAAALSAELEAQNALRQMLEREMAAEARRLIDRDGRRDDPALVLARPGWHAGVIGIVAGRLAEQFGRPALMIALPEEGGPAAVGLAALGLGSGRSVPGFALNEALAACGDLLVGHGGHPMAAGFKIRPENVGAFRTRFCDAAANHFPGGMPAAPELTLDAEVPLSALTLGLLRDLDRLEPYGAENRKPLFLAGGLEVVGEPRKVGQGERHLSFRVRQGEVALKAIAWNMAERVAELMAAGGACCLAFTPKLNEWQGRRNVDLEVTDLQPGSTARLA
jgi:single-stranded-DNA-specific exonuclease